MAIYEADVIVTHIYVVSNVMVQAASVEEAKKIMQEIAEEDIDPESVGTWLFQFEELVKVSE